MTTSDNQPRDVVDYHRELAAGWEERYRKPSFAARMRVFGECLAGRNLNERDWLDAGCGSGTLTRYLAEHGARVVGVDAAEEMIAQARELVDQRELGQRLRFEHVVTIASLPFEDRSLDGILCSSVLEYVTDPAVCLTEFARVVRPGGLLVVSVANRNSVVRWAQIGTHRFGRLFRRQWWAFLDHSHHQFTASGFRVMLKEHGFATSKVIPFGSPIPEWFQRQQFGGSLLAFCALRE